MSMDILTDFSKQNVQEIVSFFKKNPTAMSSYLEKLFAFVESSNQQYNAITSIQKGSALKRADELSCANFDQIQAMPLFGVPVFIKENIQKKDFPIECASKILKGYKGQYDASAIMALETAGAIIVGTANMDEFAMGASNEHSAHGAVKNPYDLTCVSGGSSGGPAVACALGYAPVTLGTETGGSVRVPASFCGIFGFKPTYGRVSRYGVVAYGSSLDQISPFARTACDLDMTMQVIGVYDPNDATSLRSRYISELNQFSKDHLDQITIGIPRQLLTNDVDASVLKAFYALEETLKQYGVKFKDVTIDGSEYALSAYYVVATAEASSNLARFDGIRYGHRASESESLTDLYCKTRSEGFGFEVKKRIILGTFALSSGYYDAFYGRAQAVRQMLIQSFEKIFSEVDFLYLPSTPTRAFKIGANHGDPLKEYLTDMFTILANLAQIPAISVPANISSQTMPIGLQFVAPKEQDARLIAFAHLLETEKLIGVRHGS